MKAQWKEILFLLWIRENAFSPSVSMDIYVHVYFKFVFLVFTMVACISCYWNVINIYHCFAEIQPLIVRVLLCFPSSAWSPCQNRKRDTFSPGCHAAFCIWQWLIPQWSKLMWGIVWFEAQRQTWHDIHSDPFAVGIICPDSFHKELSDTKRTPLTLSKLLIWMWGLCSFHVLFSSYPPPQ